MMKHYIHHSDTDVLGAYSSIEKAITAIGCMRNKYGGAVKLSFGDSEFVLTVDSDCKIEKSNFNRKQMCSIRRLLREMMRTQDSVKIEVGDRDYMTVLVNNISLPV